MSQKLHTGNCRGLADPANPFDETIEHLWTKQWFFYANSVRYASAMGGHGYATFKNGWWELTANLVKMKDMVVNQKKGGNSLIYYRYIINFKYSRLKFNYGGMK